MWRAFFLACGIYACILGAECMVVDTFVMAGQSPIAAKPPSTSEPASFFGSTQPPPLAVQSAKKDLKPPEWAPWSLLSVGAVTILYSLTLARQGG